MRSNAVWFEEEYTWELHEELRSKLRKLRWCLQVVWCQLRYFLTRKGPYLRPVGSGLKRLVCAV